MTQVRSRFEGGKEHTGVQCMDGTVKDDDETMMKSYSLVWLEVQLISDQDGLLDGQENSNAELGGRDDTSSTS